MDDDKAFNDGEQNVLWWCQNFWKTFYENDKTFNGKTFNGDDFTKNLCCQLGQIGWEKHNHWKCDKNTTIILGRSQFWCKFNVNGGDLSMIIHKQFWIEENKLEIIKASTFVTMIKLVLNGEDKLGE